MNNTLLAGTIGCWLLLLQQLYGVNAGKTSPELLWQLRQQKLAEHGIEMSEAEANKQFGTINFGNPNPQGPMAPPPLQQQQIPNEHSEGRSASGGHSSNQLPKSFDGQTTLTADPPRMVADHHAPFESYNFFHGDSMSFTDLLNSAPVAGQMPNSLGEVAGGSHQVTDHVFDQMPNSFGQMAGGSHQLTDQHVHVPLESQNLLATNHNVNLDQATPSANHFSNNSGLIQSEGNFDVHGKMTMENLVGPLNMSFEEPAPSQYTLLGHQPLEQQQQLISQNQLLAREQVEKKGKAQQIPADQPHSLATMNMGQQQQQQFQNSSPDFARHLRENQIEMDQTGNAHIGEHDQRRQLVQQVAQNPYSNFWQLVDNEKANQQQIVDEPMRAKEMNQQKLVEWLQKEPQSAGKLSPEMRAFLREQRRPHVGMSREEVDRYYGPINLGSGGEQEQPNQGVYLHFGQPQPAAAQPVAIRPRPVVVQPVAIQPRPLAAQLVAQHSQPAAAQLVAIQPRPVAAQLVASQPQPATKHFVAQQLQPAEQWPNSRKRAREAEEEGPTRLSPESLRQQQALAQQSKRALLKRPAVDAETLQALRKGREQQLAEEARQMEQLELEEKSLRERLQTVKEEKKRLRSNSVLAHYPSSASGKRQRHERK